MTNFHESILPADQVLPEWLTDCCPNCDSFEPVEAYDVGTTERGSRLAVFWCKDCQRFWPCWFAVGYNPLYFTPFFPEGGDEDA